MKFHEILPTTAPLFEFNPSVTSISDNKATEQRTPTEIIRSPGMIGGGSNTSAVFSFQGRDPTQ